MGPPLPSRPPLLYLPNELTTNPHPQAHPKYGNILASSSYDGKVLIWREASAQWTKVADFALHTASVNIVSWSPHECGCLLACASSDGMVSVLEFSEGNWGHTIFQAHAMGVNAVSWAPAIMPGSLVSSKPELGSRRRFVTGGSDCAVKIWDWAYVSFSISPHHENDTLADPTAYLAPHKNPTPTPQP